MHTELTTTDLSVKVHLCDNKQRICVCTTQTYEEAEATKMYIDRMIEKYQPTIEMPDDVVRIGSFDYVLIALLMLGKTRNEIKTKYNLDGFVFKRELLRALNSIADDTFDYDVFEKVVNKLKNKIV